MVLDTIYLYQVNGKKLKKDSHFVCGKKLNRDWTSDRLGSLDFDQFSVTCNEKKSKIIRKKAVKTLKS